MYYLSKEIRINSEVDKMKDHTCPYSVNSEPERLL